MAEQQGQEKTEAPTERKRRKSRDEGQVAFSRELSSAVILAGCTLILLFTSPIILDAVRGMMQFSFTEFFLKEDLTIPFLYKVLSDNLTSLLPAFVPLAMSLIALALLASILQVGIHFTLKSLAPKFNKISPLTGLKRLFSTQSLADFLKSLFKMVIIGFIGVYIYLSKLNEINGLSVSSPEQIMIYNFTALAEIAGMIVLALLAIAVFDYIYQRWHHEQQLKMTKQEVKDENKQTEGDPLLKQRIRQIQREMSNARMIQEVPKADALIVNPTHFSVAIQYDRELMDAPAVIAKGADFLAFRMRTVARENDVPILERPVLARDLYVNVEIGETIPERFYKAVAEILAYVYRLRSA